LLDTPDGSDTSHCKTLRPPDRGDVEPRGATDFCVCLVSLAYYETCIGTEPIMAKTSPAQFVRQVRQEISRISWASRRETGTATITVFVMATIAALFFLLVDMVLSNIVQLVLGLGG
jgi:preprotein translocase subunit SecE